MRRILILFFLSAASSLYATTAYVLDTATETKFVAAFGDTSRRTWSTEDGVLRTLVGRTSQKDGARGSADTARQQLQEYLGIPVEHMRLNSARTVVTPDDTHYEFTQTVNVGGSDLPIENVSVVIDVNSIDEIVGVSNQALKNPVLASTKARLPEVAAKCFAAVAFLGVAANCDGPVTVQPPGSESLEMNARQILYAVPPLVRWAWAVELASDEMHAYRQYVIDAQAGFVLEVRERVHKSGPHALVFNPSPFADKTVTSADNVNLRPQPFPPYLGVTLDDLKKSADGFLRLQGDLIQIIDMDNKHIGVINDDIVAQIGTTAGFDSQRGTSKFASAMGYYHGAAVQQYVKSLGFRVIPELRVDVRRDPFEWKSEYTNRPVGGGFLLFGFLNDGKLFQAEDGDVVIHEHGHAVQATQAGDRFDRGDKQTMAMAEGFSDYWAMSFFERAKQDNHLDVFCMGEWIKRISGDKGCTRVINPDATFDDFKGSNDEYENATVWTAVLWAIRSNLNDRQAADKLLVRSLSDVLKESPVIGPDFAAGARAIFMADGALNRGAHYDALCTIFDQRKILKKEDCPPRPNH
jgi:hypothetical protein